jgi:thiol-disulfide isomerase/thioredoxin
MNCQVLAFSTEDCPACDIAKPIVKGIARKFGIIVKELDPTIEIELAQQYDVSLLPTFVLLDEDGERIESAEGMIDEKMAVSLLSLAKRGAIA